MITAIPDAMVETFAVVGTPDEVRAQIDAPLGSGGFADPDGALVLPQGRAGTRLSAGPSRDAVPLSSGPIRVHLFVLIQFVQLAQQVGLAAGSSLLVRKGRLWRG